MCMLVGEYYMKISAQNKISIPKDFVRVCETDEFIVKKDDFMGCLVVYPLKNWKEELAFIKAKVRESITSHELQNYFRIFMKNTHKTKLIKNSTRITIPQKFMKVFNHENEVVLVGLDHKLEIWPASKYGEIENYFKNLGEQFLQK